MNQIPIQWYVINKASREHSILSQNSRSFRNFNMKIKIANGLIHLGLRAPTALTDVFIYFMAAHFDIRFNFSLFIVVCLL